MPCNYSDATPKGPGTIGPLGEICPETPLPFALNDDHVRRAPYFRLGRRHPGKEAEAQDNDEQSLADAPAPEGAQTDESSGATTDLDTDNDAIPTPNSTSYSTLPPSENLSQGRVELNLPDDNPAAFQILLNIIHGHVRKVPDQVDLKTMTKLSVLVDKYQVHKVVELIVQRTANSKLGENGEIYFPIPSVVLDKIESARQKAISGIIASISKIFDRFKPGDAVCKTRFDDSDVLDGNVACDGPVAFTLQEAPYQGLSLRSQTKKVRKLKMLAVCDQGKFRTMPGTRTDSRPAHGWNKWLTDEADRIQNTANGLSLHSITS
ncbi:uncharacterized protein PAC_10445 [Phialocephala subalpina]|uniref:BTB domain-containing protein n=1 Tax=Phialocephala subalpina TaxID=576137 RepID=A0A1L7X691_9HELO|nr:uncharacterized protein PAC_10445 [Phialocephala subalpina]